MRNGDRTALMAMRFTEAAELERLCAVHQEVKDLSLLLRWRREMKYSPEQPRDEIGRWMPWEHGEGDEPSSDGGGSDDAFGIAPDGTEIEGVAGIPDSEKNSTVQSFMSKYCAGRIREVMLGQFLNMTIEEVMGYASLGDPMANRCMKLLKEKRFRK